MTGLDDLVTSKLNRSNGYANCLHEPQCPTSEACAETFLRRYEAARKQFEEERKRFAPKPWRVPRMTFCKPRCGCPASRGRL